MSDFNKLNISVPKESKEIVDLERINFIFCGQVVEGKELAKVLGLIEPQTTMACTKTISPAH
jgi:hypothetical protein